MPDAPAQPSTPAPSSAVSTMALVTEAAPGSPTATSSPGTPPVEQAAPPKAPQSAVERVLARATNRQAQEQARAQETRLRELEAMEAAVKAGQYQRVDPQAMERQFLDAFTADPIGFMQRHKVGADVQRNFLRTFTQGVLNPNSAALAQRVAQLEAGRQGEPQAQQQAPSFNEQYKAMRAREEAEKAFDAASTAKNGEAFTRPLIARMQPAQRIQWAHEIADELREAGVSDFSFEDIADVMEERRALLYREVAGEDPPHLRQPQAGASGTNTTSSATSSGTQAATAVITNDLAAGGPPRAPTSQEERDVAAARELAVLFANRR